ncbi:MAG: hypothetical protein M1831_000796 [Alyxoria varia]|nr:MAG: hypothetical protein M1831_000796 [Alyxoria varia]
MSNRAPGLVVELTAKLYDADSDIRYMSLNDLSTLFKEKGPAITPDLHACNKVADGFVNTLNDPNGEVQNLTIKCLDPFTLASHPETLRTLLQKLTTLTTENAVDSSVSAMAVRAMVVAIPNHGFFRVSQQRLTDMYLAISRVLIPCLVGYNPITQKEKGLTTSPPTGLLERDLEQGTDSNYIDVLIEITKSFGRFLRKEERQALLDVSMKLLESERAGSAMKKKALQAISRLAKFFSPEVLSTFLSHLMESLRQPHITVANRRLYISLLGSLAQATKHLGPHLKTLSPFIFAALSQADLDQQMENSDEGERDPQGDELREAALATLETLLLVFPQDMALFQDETLQAVIRFLKYDPNFSFEDMDEDEPDEDLDLDEDFEQDDVGDDDDDFSWKVRRAAAKTLYSFIASNTNTVLETPSIFETILKVLVERFKEREENVRLQVLQTISYLIQNTQQHVEPEPPQFPEAIDQTTAQIPYSSSRKRRRGESYAMLESPKFGRFTGSVSPASRSPPREGAAAYLVKMKPHITKELLALIKSSTPASKQTALVALRDLVIAQRGGLDEFLNETLGLLNDHIDPAGKNVDVAVGSGTGSAASVQIEAIRLASDLAKAHSSSAIQPLMAKAIPVVVSAARSRSPTVSSEALGTLEQFIKVLTPPRIANVNQKTSAQLEQLINVLVDVMSVKTADLAIRQKAISILGILLGRTCNSKGSKLLSETKRRESLNQLYEMSKNETLRHATYTTINTMGKTGTSDGTFDSSWLSKVLLDMSDHLRRTDRSIRGASLVALRTFISDRAASSDLDDKTNKQLISDLQPLLVSGDLHMIGPCLVIFAAMARDCSVDIVDDDFVANICSLVASDNASLAIDQLCVLMNSIGQRGNGKSLMQALLQNVGIGGSPAVVGKVIGELLVAGEGSVGVKIPDFLNELKTTRDNKRKCLALSVLGEVGLRSGPSSSLTPELFTSHFISKSEDVSLAAATALGRVAAGSGNIKSYAPVILSNLKGGARDQYLVLHSVKELFQYGDNATEMGPFMGPLWEASVAAAREEKSRTIGAECVANLAIVDPNTYLSSLRELLNDQGSSVRGTAILAFRDVFTATDTSYDKHLEPTLMEVLAAMLKDEDVENRRSALNTFNAAFRGKFKLVLPHLPGLVPLIIKHTHADPALIREIDMGPFKHKIDDGLEFRKVAYEILYSLLELTVTTQIDISAIYDRLVDGLGDDHSIRSLCNLMILKMARGRAPREETSARLDLVVDKYRVILATQLKETAVRYEIEQQEEAIKGAVKTSLELASTFPPKGPHGGEQAGNTGAQGTRMGGVRGSGTSGSRGVVRNVEDDKGDTTGVRSAKWATFLSELWTKKAEMCKEWDKQRRAAAAAKQNGVSNE